MSGHDIKALMMRIKLAKVKGKHQVLGSKVYKIGKFKGELHPRGPDGKFASKPGLSERAKKVRAKLKPADRVASLQSKVMSKLPVANRKGGASTAKLSASGTKYRISAARDTVGARHEAVAHDKGGTYTREVNGRLTHARTNDPQEAKRWRSHVDKLGRLRKQHEIQQYGETPGQAFDRRKRETIKRTPHLKPGTRQKLFASSRGAASVDASGAPSKMSASDRLARAQELRAKRRARATS